MKLNSEILKFSKKFNKQYKDIIRLIKEYDYIAIFRHVRPDFDAYACQFGLYTWIKDNFPQKEVKAFGDNHISFAGRIYPNTDKVSDTWFSHKFLAIICDVPNRSRTSDPRYEKADKIIRIDHHIKLEEFGHIQLVDPNCIACAEIIGNFMIKNSKKYFISKQTASYLFSGIVGDSGRFQYANTSSHTFAVSQYLVSTGFDLPHIYQEMYLKPINDLEVRKYILNNYQVTEKGVAYYILDRKALSALNLTTEQGKDNINIFSNIDGINIWMSITEDLTENIFRVSIRSKEIHVDLIANKYEGGGHHLAVGAKLKSLSELPNLLKDLDNLVK